MTENTANVLNIVSQGTAECHYIRVSFEDIMNPKPVEQRTADEIINDIQAEFDRLGFETK